MALKALVFALLDWNKFNLELSSLSAFALPGIPLIKQGADIPSIIIEGIASSGTRLQAGDILVISSKIISKSEGRLVNLNTVNPGEKALHYAEITGKDPRVVELVLNESLSISRASRGVMVVEHRLGFISANAGIDQSNVGGTQDDVLLLPLDPDVSAQQIRQRLLELTGIDVAIVISDTHGRPFRLGNVGVAIGVAGLLALTDLRGQDDLFGRKLMISSQGYADLIASTAHLLCGEANEGRPVIVIRGLDYPRGNGSAKDLVRPAHQDLYR